jgi:hypothetical protein
MVRWSGSSPAGCISIRVAVTLSVMSGILPLQSSCCMTGLPLWFQGFGCGYGYDYIIIMIIVFTYLDIDMGQCSACLCMF